MDILKAMQVFVQVAELASFSRAAERLGLPPASVTTTVQSLERELGARLLQRTTRRVGMTQEGEQYLERCRQVLAEVEDAQGLFLGPKRLPRGAVGISLPERLARQRVIPALPGFLESYPDIQLRLNATDRVIDLLEQGIDCAVRVGELADSSLAVRPLGRMRQVNCAAPAYLARFGTPQQPNELREHRVVLYHSNRLARDLAWEYMVRGEQRSLKIPGSVVVSSTDAYLACGLAGIGLIQVPRHGIEDLLANGQLVEVLSDYPPPMLPVTIVYAGRPALLPPRVRVVVDWLAEVVGMGLVKD